MPAPPPPASFDAGPYHRPLAAVYDEHKGYVLSILARHCGWLDASDREAVFHDAYAIRLEKQDRGQLAAGAMHPHQVLAYLTQTAINKVLDDGKRPSAG